MQHPPSEDPSIQASNTQGLEVNKSNLTNSPVGQAGGNVNQASGDINYFFNSVQNDLPEDKIEKIKRFEESLRAEFKEKFDRAALLVNDLRTCIELQLTGGAPKDDPTILRLLDELQSILGKESRLKEITEDLEFCHKGGIWLQQNKPHLARYAKEYIFKQKNGSSILGEATSKLSFGEIEKRFLQDIETYISWISIYLKAGTTPQSKDFEEGIFSVYLDLPQSAYKGAFEALNIDMVDPIASGLSIEAANSTASYFNRFIIDRNLSKDTKKRAWKKFLDKLTSSRFASSKAWLVLLVICAAALILLLR
jgi:hypothetical protein